MQNSSGMQEYLYEDLCLTDDMDVRTGFKKKINEVSK